MTKVTKYHPNRIQRYAPAFANVAGYYARKGARYLGKKAHDYAASRVSNYLKSRSTARQTQQKMWRRTKNKVSTQSRFKGPTTSGGFTKRQSRGGYRKYTRRSTIAFAGASMNHECGTIAADEHCIYVGHHSMPTVMARKCLALTIVKYFMKRLDICANSFDDAVPFLTTGDVLRFTYRPNVEAAVTTTSVSITAASSMETMANDIVTALASFAEQVTPVSWEFMPFTGSYLRYCILRLAKAKVNIVAKSALKMQNRSQSGTDDDANDVDNIPIHGKSYFGKGNGTDYMGNPNSAIVPFYADSTNGIISKPSGGADEDEPPLPQYFNKVFKASKEHFEPGVVKTSTISFKQKMQYVTLFKGLYTGTTPQYRASRLGNFKMYALEKMIDVETVGPDVTMAMEHDIKMYMSIENGPPAPTAPLISRLVI